MAAQQLTRRQAVLVGVVTAGCGMFPVLVGLGVLHPSKPSTAPPWVPIAAGLVFICGGFAVILDYAVAGGMGSDGDFVPGTPFPVRVASFLVGLAIVGLMLALFGWVAFGPGPREFSTTMSIPFLAERWPSSGLSGRIAFGFATALLAIMFFASGVSGAKRLFRTHRETARDQIN